MLEHEIPQENTDISTSIFKFDKQILSIVYRKRLKYIILLSLTAMIIAGVWAKVRITPTWKANCFVIRAPKNMSTPSEMPYLYQTFDLNTVLETVRTRNVLLDVIKKLRLKNSPDDLYKAIEVQRGNRSNVLKFSTTWNEREMAAQIANATAESFIKNNTLLQNSATLKIYNYYIQQRQDRAKTINDLEQKYEQFRGQYGIISIPNETQEKFDQLKAVELNMISNNLRITEMDTKINEIDNKIKEVTPEVIRSWTFTENDTKKLLQLQKELELLRTKYTDDNPKIRKVLKEIDDLKAIAIKDDPKRNIPESVTWGPNGLIEVYTIDKARYEAEKASSAKLNSNYMAKINSLRAELENLTQIQKEFFELERQLQLNKDILRVIEGRLAEAKMAMESNISDYEVVEPAKPPLYPEGTQRKLLVMIIGLAVFVLSSLWVIGNELLDFSIKSEMDFTDVIGIPMIGQLPNEDQVEKHVFYRNLQVIVDSIVRINNGKEQPVVCFGSDIPETGKSFILNDIIKMYLGLKKKVLYIDTVSAQTPDVEPYIINSFLYNGIDTINIDKTDSMLHKAYFIIDDSIFNAVLDTNRLHNFFFQLKDYDIIFWELFDCHYHVQLFATITAASDLLVLIGRFKRSSRNIFTNIVNFVQRRGFKNIYGVLNYIHIDYYQEKY